MYLHLGNRGGGVILDDAAVPWATAAYLLLMNFLCYFLSDVKKNTREGIFLLTATSEVVCMNFRVPNSDSQQ